MRTTPEAERGWQTFLKGLELNDADMIEDGMLIMSRAVHPDKIQESWDRKNQHAHQPSTSS